MLEPKVWREAATQVFFALGLGFGGVIAFSSYNKRDNNCHFDAVLVSFINFFTSVLATLVVFAVLGFKANIINEKCIVQYEYLFIINFYRIFHLGISILIILGDCVLLHFCVCFVEILNKLSAFWIVEISARLSYLIILIYQVLQQRIIIWFMISFRKLKKMNFLWVWNHVKLKTNLIRLEW